MSSEDETATLRARLEASRAENEVLLQQITRLCLYIEQTSGGTVDPIEIMHGRDAPLIRPSPPATPTSGGWLRGLLSRTGFVADGNDGLARERAHPATSQGAFASPPSGSKSASQAEQLSPSKSTESTEAGADATIDDSPLVENGVAAATFAWRGDPEAVAELERNLSESQFVAEATLDGAGLTRLPSSPTMWLQLARTLTSLSLNSNGLVELPVAMGKLRHLRKLRMEGNLLRELPAPILALTRLEELGLACNQLTGLPEGIGNLSRLTELWLVSNEISYLPQSIGTLTRLRKLELSANALHELPRSIAKLRALTHLWLSNNSLSTFPQPLCALDHLEVLDVHGNQLTTIPRVVGTMPALKTLLLEGNPLSFPPVGVVAQGAAAVLDYVRSHRQSDLMSSDAERSLKAVQAYRGRLAESIDAQEEQQPHIKGSSGARGEAAVVAPPSGGGGGRAASPKDAELPASSAKRLAFEAMEHEHDLHPPAGEAAAASAVEDSAEPADEAAAVADLADADSESSTIEGSTSAVLGHSAPPKETPPQPPRRGRNASFFD